MDKAELTVKAERLKLLIAAPEPLVLPNVWDVASARIVADAGYPVIATSSAGIAWCLGYADGEKISRDDMLFMVRRIAAGVDLPVTADMEAGYGEAPDAVAETVVATMEAGAVGANIEDSSPAPGHPLLDFDLSVERIRAGKAEADAAGVPFVINARTDGFAGGLSEEAFAESVKRANAYLEAGAGCVFVPFVRDDDMIARLAAAIDGPLNILAGASSPPLPHMQEMGVARISVGGLFSLMTYTNVRTACRELSETGTYGWAQDVILHPEMNGLMCPA
ncbi:MAG: isocitrate lyase/phosphoenolpyruvate mutase family protein [Alphaproteobacteria bacterium]|jgi:2-methylisocitrate lyase-like PEP mutase family enzyme